MRIIIRKSCPVLTVLFLCLPVFLLSGCGSSGSTGTSAAGKYTVAARVLNSAPASACPNGGITVETGVDTNGNGVLDPSEVQNTQYVCNGAPGTNGTNGTNGQTSLVSITAEPAGANCTYGGSKISSGLDANGDGILQASEVTGTSYICNGSNGTNGTNGTNGYNTLLDTTAEPAGANCAYGGLKVTSGQDTNRDGILQASEVTSTSYVCNGAGIDWVDVTGTSVQAASNTGYIADNSSQVTITLPPVPSMGDIVQVTGAGAGGWKIAQNAGQSIDARALASWTRTYALVGSWPSVASSSDGTHLVAVSSGGGIYTSSNSGSTWAQTSAPTTTWQAVASSSDGTHLVAASSVGGIYKSSNSGSTWAKTSAPIVSYWQAVASSSDGTHLVAASTGTGSWGIYTSSDSGSTWTQTSAPVENYTAVASSSDGTHLVAVSSGGGIYTSSDSGSTWTQMSAPFATYASVASSSDGAHLVATATGGIYAFTSSTTIGTAGSLSGGQYDAVELQYIGGGVFMPISYAGSGFVVQ